MQFQAGFPRLSLGEALVQELTRGDGLGQGLGPPAEDESMSARPKETTQASEDRERHGVLPMSVGVGKDCVKGDAEGSNVGNTKEHNDAGRQHFRLDQVYARQQDRGCSRYPSKL